MADDRWVVVMEHLMAAPYLQIDGASMNMLFAETQLREAGIDTRFEPFRPDQSYDFRSTSVSVTLQVRDSDLARAQEILHDIAADAE